jgi:hypothetical protein
LRVQKIARAARDHRAGLRIGKWQRVQSFAAQQAQQCVPRRMKLERVDALAARAEAREFGRVAVRQIGEREHVGCGQRGAVARERLAMPRRAFAPDGGGQRGIARKQVVVRKRRDLIGHFVRVAGAEPFHLMSPFDTRAPAIVQGAVLLERASRVRKRRRAKDRV